MINLGIVKDKSSCVVKNTLLDESGNAVIPTSGKWTLFDSAGNIVNSRQDVVISSLASVTYIPLTGDDLDADIDNQRHLLIEFEYLSSLTGTTLDKREMGILAIEDFPYA